MAVDFSQYKQSRAQATQKLVESMNKKGGYTEDTRFWKPTLDKEKGTGGAVIRFLPVADTSTLDYVDFTQYSFKWEKTEQWFIAKSRYKLKEITGSDELSVDPIYELRQRLYATKQDIDKKIAETLRANKVFIANIEVIKDPSNPENNGKRFLYRYNTTINKLIEAGLKPVADPVTGEVPNVIDAFDLIDGANLEIRIKHTKQGWDYEGTKFSTPSAHVKTEEEFNSVMSSVYPLGEFIAIDSFQSYDQMNSRLARVINEDYIGSGVKVLTKPVGGGSTSNYESNNKPQEQTKTSNYEQTTSSYIPSTQNDDVPFDADNIVDDDSFFDDLMSGINK